MIEPDRRLLFDPEARIARKDLLASVPNEAVPVVRELWARRQELSEWLAADPERAERLVADPAGSLREALPGIELLDTLPGEELRRQILQDIPMEQVTLKLEQADPQTVDALRLLGRLIDSVAAGLTTPAQIAADPEAAVRAVADSATSPDSIIRIVEAIRFVMLPLMVRTLEVSPIGTLPTLVESLSSRVRLRTGRPQLSP